MHDIEPWHGWRDEYIAENDAKSPFYKRTYSEFTYSNRIYNYLIHPQWDAFGSETLYAKLIFTNYSHHFCVIELIGEWNDAIGNDGMFIKRNLVDPLIEKSISKFIIIMENVLNFHGDDDCYYEEWYDDIKDSRGWIALVQTLDHVALELKKYRLYYYLNWAGKLQQVSWRNKTPLHFFQEIEHLLQQNQKHLNDGKS
ncbi:MAG: hypothetical protein R2774_06000 [Saprospiraceae bacterium]